MKRACDLCKQTARIRCESDQASLCWVCDAKVHSANFLVARHPRTLLCRVCQSPTRWSAAGSKLEPTFSTCRTCVDRTGCGQRNGEDENEAVKEEQEVVESQIVPCSPAPPPPASESSLCGGEVVATRKRRRLGSDCLAPDYLNIRAPLSDTAADSGSDSTFGGIGISQRKIGGMDACEVAVRASKSLAAEAVRRFDYEETISGEETTEYLSGGRSAVDLNLSLSLFSR